MVLIQPLITTAATPSIFFQAPIRPSIPAEAICFVDGSGRLLDQMIQATHHDHDIGPNSPRLHRRHPPAAAPDTVRQLSPLLPCPTPSASCRPCCRARTEPTSHACIDRLLLQQVGNVGGR
ncbi:hypothetical protein ACLOJK_028550 [Asimina triloba]